MFSRNAKPTMRTVLIVLAWSVVLAVGIALFLLGRFVASTEEVASFALSDTTTDLGLPREAAGRSADLLSAFHGLDALPRLANLACRGAKGQGGMPVIFSTEIDLDTMQAGDFEVTTASGQTGVMHCVSLLPATDPGELRTVLLIGQLGPADSDPPVRVEISGNVHSIDGALNFRGASVPVTPLAEGPSMIVAEVVDDWTLVGNLGPDRVRGSSCPAESTLQAVRVTWAGGVTLANGDEPGAAERDLYAITVEAEDGTRRDVPPAALADLGDGDNNHMLCMDTADRPVSVSFPAGILTDPNDDLNPATTVDVTVPQ